MEQEAQVMQAGPVSVDAFRAALRLFASGVTVVTLRAGDRVHGLTVSAFTSISASPPLVAVVIDRHHLAHALLEEPGAVFAVNILCEEQREISDRFAFVKDEDRFATGRWSSASTGAPVLADAVAWLDCTIHSRLDAGSHTIYVGEVQASAAPSGERRPLVYWSRAYRVLDRTRE
jgi:flavin reductase ActVB